MVELSEPLVAQVLGEVVAVESFGIELGVPFEALVVLRMGGVGEDRDEVLVATGTAAILRWSSRFTHRNDSPPRVSNAVMGLASAEASYPAWQRLHRQ